MFGKLPVEKLNFFHMHDANNWNYQIDFDFTLNHNACSLLCRICEKAWLSPSNSALHDAWSNRFYQWRCIQLKVWLQLTEAQTKFYGLHVDAKKFVGEGQLLKEKMKKVIITVRLKAVYAEVKGN